MNLQKLRDSNYIVLKIDNLIRYGMEKDQKVRSYRIHSHLMHGE